MRHEGLRRESKSVPPAGSTTAISTKSTGEDNPVVSESKTTKSLEIIRSLAHSMASNSRLVAQAHRIHRFKGVWVLSKALASLSSSIISKLFLERKASEVSVAYGLYSA
jgi:hypothetical protein